MMLPANVVRYITAAGISLTWLNSHFAEPFKNLVLSRSDVRLYKEEHPREQLIAVCNAGHRAADPISARVELPVWALADFSSGPTIDGNPVSFWKLLSEADLERLGFQSGKPGSGFLDQHYKTPGLDSYRAASRAALKGLLVSQGHAASQVDRILSSDQAHTEWLGRCSPQASAGSTATKLPQNCAIEERLEAVEMGERQVFRSVANSWRVATGVQVDLSPSDGSFDFLFIPEGQHCYYLTLRYGKATKSATVSFPLPPSETRPPGFWSRLVQSFRDTSIWIGKREDLQASAWWILLRYQTTFLILGFFVMVSCVMASRPGLTAVSRMATNEVFNLALRTIGTANNREWSAAYQRVAPELPAEFDRHCSALGKKCPNVSRPELFDGIRTKMTIDYGKGTLHQFADQLHLDESLHEYLSEMARTV